MHKNTPKARKNLSQSLFLQKIALFANHILHALNPCPSRPTTDKNRGPKHPKKRPHGTPFFDPENTKNTPFGTKPHKRLFYTALSPTAVGLQSDHSRT